MTTISSIRSRLGVTQEVLARALGVSQGNISHYERGQAIPPAVAGKLISFARSKGVTLTFDEIYASEKPTYSTT